MAHSTIPAAIDNFIQALRAYPLLNTIAIIDGQPTTDVPGSYLIVGFTEDMGASVSGNQSPTVLGNLRRQEIYSINCEISTWSGTTVMKTVRDQAFQIFGNVEDVIRADASLGGAVVFADIGQMDLSQVQTTNGAVANIKFNVSVKITRI